MSWVNIALDLAQTSTDPSNGGGGGGGTSPVTIAILAAIGPALLGAGAIISAFKRKKTDDDEENPTSKPAQADRVETITNIIEKQETYNELTFKLIISRIDQLEREVNKLREMNK